MKPRDIAYYLYFAASICAIIAGIISNESLLLIAKPVIIPSIYFYYLTKTRKPENLVALLLLSNFIGDSIVLLQFGNTLLIIVPYLVGYLLAVRLIIGDIAGERPNLLKIIVSALVMAMLTLLVFVLLDIRDDDGTKYITPMTIYGVILSLMVALSIFSYMLHKSVGSFYMMIFCVCSLISDVFYAIYNLHFHIPMLNYINTTMQFFSYFFIVKYAISRKNTLVTKQVTE